MDHSSLTSHAAAVQRLVSSGTVATPGAPCDVSIAESWRRCALQYSLDPMRRRAPTILDEFALERRRAQHASLLQIASAEIDWLYDQIAQSGYALVLTDTSGIVLYRRADTTLDRMLRTSGLVAGADWSEQCEGTNGIGTCIAEDRPLTVHREEHFRDCHIGLCCSGSPIHDPSGSLLAVLDASTVNEHDTCTSQAHTMALVNLSAQVIEKCVFLQHYEQDTVLRFHSRPELVNLQHDGALALAGDATVIAIDRTALRLLGVAHAADVIGSSVDDIFDVRAEDLLCPNPSGRTVLWPVRDIHLGRRFFATLVHGTGGTRISGAAARRAEPGPVLKLAATHHKSARTLEDLAGEDPQMLRNVRSAHRIADSQVPVMIQGATGAGKEVFARALHCASRRAADPFVALNCAAIPESLIESELFGYKPGAFTGARREGMRGKILQSSGGTLFLDEIGDMPLVLQTRLLRVLEEQEVVPLGAETPIKVDLRVICASHQNLRTMIARGRFREDLYYRLNGITLELPTLAQRTDKERLIREFLAAETSDGRPAAIEMDAFQCLLAYGWPGNIRELRNVIRTALAICNGGVVRLKDLPSEVRRSTADADSDAPAAGGTVDRQTCSPLDAAERDTLLRTIRASAGNMSRAARYLGISRNTLYRRCKRLHVALHRTQGVLQD